MVRKLNSGLLRKAIPKFVVSGLAALILSSGCELEDSPPGAPEPNLDNLSSSGGHLYSGDSWNHAFKVEPNSAYTLHFQYSNDDDEQKDVIAVYADGNLLGTFHPKDTGDWGYGWANYVDSPTYSFNTVPDAEEANIGIVALKTDSYGFRIGAVLLDRKIPVEQPAEEPAE